MITLLATAAVVLLIGWTAKTLTAKHRRAHELHVLTDREIVDALAPRPEPIAISPARNPRADTTRNPD